MFLLIDNYDSFTYNLVQAFQNLGEDPVVLFNDDPKILELAASGTLSKVVLSPGPGHPSAAGLCLEFLQKLPPSVPVLGVCLGHQILGLFGGAEVKTGPVIMHGMQSAIQHDGTGLFQGVPDPFTVGRYHSLVVCCDEKDEDKYPFRVTARGPENEVMALEYKDRPWAGVQFHPESVLTPDGLRLLSNFPDSLHYYHKDKQMDEKKPQTAAAAEQEKPQLKTIMERLAMRQDLDASMAQTAFDMLMDGDMTPVQTGAFLMGLRAKGETSLELRCAIRSVLARAVAVPPLPAGCIDVVGTGGDGRSSFNCSTCSCLTLAGMGYKVAKHGNAAVSSTSGAADALSLLGIPLEKEADKIVEQIEKTNFGFFFAPNFHPSFRHVGPARRELGIRTLFNILGPMINPSRPPYLLMGVARPELVRLIADTLSSSETLERAAIAYGAGGYDEVTPMGPATIIMLDHGKQIPMTLDPAEFGIGPCTPEDVAVHSKEEAVSCLRELLQGRGNSHMKDMVVLNVGLAIHVIDGTKSLASCMKEARDAVEGGAGSRFVKNA